MVKRACPCLASACFLLWVVGPVLVAAESDAPLHVEIDAIIGKQIAGPIAPLADDAEFLRRIFLDLTGTIPSADTARRFLDDTASDKRARLIDRLLYSRAYARWMQTFFSVMLMECRPDQHVSNEHWERFLRDSFARNKPYNQLAREILASDGAAPTLRGAAKFFLDHGGETTLLTRDVARIFFGIDLQCAPCHDHPLVDDYQQSDFFGLNAFLSRSSVHEFQEIDYDSASGTVTFVYGDLVQG